MKNFKETVRSFLPNWIFEKLSGLYRVLFNHKIESVGIKNSDWYNKAYKNTTAYHIHYTESNYYFLWTVILDRIKRCRSKSIIDLGCGSGQFALLLNDNNIKNYLGVDFSSEAIEIAKITCRNYDFKVLDLTQSNILSIYDYDCVVTMELLEHVEFDLEVLQKIKPGIKVFATVPNFPYISHVRHFVKEQAVSERYSHLFSDFSVSSFLENLEGKRFFLIEGTKK